MRAKFEVCPRCGSRELRNIFVVVKGEPPRVYVQCAKCESFVARYTLLKYTSDQPYESLLRILRRGHAPDSRRFLKELEAFTQKVQEEYEKALSIALKGVEKRRIEELLEEHEEEGEPYE